MKKNCTIFPQPLNVLALDNNRKKEGLLLLKPYYGDFPGGLVVKKLPATAGYMSLIPVREDPTWHGATKPVYSNDQACTLQPESREC